VYIVFVVGCFLILFLHAAAACELLAAAGAYLFILFPPFRRFVPLVMGGDKRCFCCALLC
jgi:hypothetical protein